jgi:hypothetical protein
MNRRESLFDTRINRRTTIKGVLAAGAGAMLAAPAFRAVAHGSQSAATAYPELVIVATEYALQIPATIEGGWTRLVLDNQGMMEHHVMFMRVNDDATLEDLEAALLEPAFEPMFAVSTSLGGPFAAPGARGSVILDLLPGTYVLICVIPDAAGVPHFALGMQAVLEVSAAVAGEAPAADATVELMEMMFHNLPTEVAAGPQVWKVDNIGGAVHEMVVAKLAPGLAFEQAQAMLLSSPEATPMDHGEATPAGEIAEAPIVIVGGAAPMSPHQTNYAEFDFVPSDYLVICFVPDATGAPHAALGMIMPFTVS